MTGFEVSCCPFDKFISNHAVAFNLDKPKHLSYGKGLKVNITKGDCSISGTWSRYLFYLKQQSYSVSRYAHAVTSLNSRASNHIPIIVPFRRLADWKDSHGKGSEGTVSKGFKRFSSQMESDVNVFIDAVNEENSPNYDKYEAYKTDVERYEFETKTVAQVQGMR